VSKVSFRVRDSSNNSRSGLFVVVVYWASIDEVRRGMNILLCLLFLWTILSWPYLTTVRLIQPILQN